MKLSDTGELSVLKRIRERFQFRAKDTIAGIGDDSAVIVPRNNNLLLTTDLMAEGVHFDLGLTTYFQLGFKIISVNVSDIYAMGGVPRFVLLDIAAPGRTDETMLEAFFDGVRTALDLYHVRLVGGDLSSSRILTVSGTLVGYVKKPVMRSGAKPGDRIYVTGNLGDSACGFALLKRIKRPVSIEQGHKTNRPLKWETMQPLLKRHLLPEARHPGKISKVATAMIDVSDGLMIDLSRVCDESRVGARVFMRKIPLSLQMKKAASFLGLKPDVLALSGGEDYELLFTASPKRTVDAVCIGEICGTERTLVDRDGTERPFSPEGYQHWR
ncbi:MAG TPA: thiamine-phosphate kinase [Thermodesulfovibrionales bacterium]|nr:thiamine-phosphate kinase [Thermodesulfovibrionales bacterium]